MFRSRSLAAPRSVTLRAALRHGLLFILLAVAARAGTPSQRAAGDWPPITPEELAIKEDPTRWGAPAILLFREEFINDRKSFERDHFRIKVLSEEGKKYANISLSFSGKLENVRARTVRPDGTAVEFTGQMYEQLVAGRKGRKIISKTFTLPNVQVGTIIEYQYTTTGYQTKWFVEHELFTRRARFQVVPAEGPMLHWLDRGLPAGKKPRLQKDGTVLLELENIPPFETEAFAPPAESLRTRVLFFYSYPLLVTRGFWNDIGERAQELVEKFIGKRGEIQRAAAALAKPGDSTEARLRKIYERVQQVRNLAYESSKTEKEVKNLKDNENVEDVLRNGYGGPGEINRLFVALARAAGLKADVAVICERDAQFFDKAVLDTRQLDGEVAIVWYDGATERYFDPGTPWNPFGLLEWRRTAATGLQLGKIGNVFVTTPQPKSSDSVVRRKASFKLNSAGALEGRLKVVFSGQEALRRRLEARDADESLRRKILEDEIKGWLRAGSTVTLTGATGWQSMSDILEADFTLLVPDYGQVTPRRLILPPAVFHTGRTHAFQSSFRLHPVYFRHPYEERDEITIEVPAGYEIEAVPNPQVLKPEFAGYDSSLRIEDGALKLDRTFVMTGYLFPTDFYYTLRAFFNTVRSSDDEQIVLRAAQSTARND